MIEEGVIILASVIVGFILGNFNHSFKSYKLDRPKQRENERPKVSVLTPQTPEAEKRNEEEVIKNKLKDAGIEIKEEKQGS